MNHNTTNPALPDADPYAEIRYRIALLRWRLDRTLSFICKAVLLLIPVLFTVAHIGADGEPWNFATGEKFSPLFHLISSYAWRSPAGWAMVGSMAGFAFGLGFVSWHAMKHGPGFFSWLTAVSASIAMFLVLQAAWLPIKPDRETFHKIQQEAAWGPTKERKQQMWSGGLYAVGVPRPEWVRSPEYLSSLRSHWIHQHALGRAQVMIIVAILGASFVWRWRSSEGSFWRLFLFWAEWVVLIIVAAGIFGRLWLPEYSGLTQRVTYLGFYLWLLVIVREIERRRIAGGTHHQTLLT